MRIPLIDLKEQYLQIKDEVDAAVLGVLEKGHYILGPNVKALEEEVALYCSARYGLGVANGTDALVLALLAFGIGPGDEVITTPFTFFATAEAISQVGAIPVFIDIDPGSYNLDPALIEEKISPRTRAIIPVHIFGQMADMDPIMELARKYNLVVIEDACQAIGAEYKGRKAGSIGHAACFSFFPTKNLGGFGDGGMVVTDSAAAAEKIAMLRVHGSSKKYYHTSLGYNSRLDEVQAAALRVKLKYLDRWNQLRNEKAALYNELLAGTDIRLPKAPPHSRHAYHLYVLVSPQRELYMQKLREAGISSGVYYPVPLHLQEVYAAAYKGLHLPAAEEVARQALALPLYPEIKPEAIHEVVHTLLKEA